MLMHALTVFIIQFTHCCFLQYEWGWVGGNLTIAK